MGARFAKWRGVIAVNDTLPSATCVNVNARARSLCRPLPRAGGGAYR